MAGILRLESLTRGNTLKQGDKTPLKYRLFDADGEKLNIAGKSAKVRLVYPDFLTIGYEKDGLTVAQDDTVTFTIDSVIPSRIYHVEIIVDDKFIFPSRADESKFTVDKSSLGTEANIIEIVGVDQIVRKAVDLINQDPSLIIDEDKLVSDIISDTGIGSINDYYQAFNDLKPRAELSITKSAEALTKSQNALNVANGIDAKATNALSLSESADTLSKSVQEQFNQIVIDGDSSVEAAQARVDADGQTNPTLKARLDKEHNDVTAQLAQNEKKTTDIFSRNNSNRIPTLSLNSEKGVVPLVSFVDDDGNEAILTKLKPVSETHGVPFSIALIGSHIESGTGIKIPDILDLQNRLGWEIASHGYNHVGFQGSGVTLEQMDYEARYSAEYLRSKGFDVKNFVYPGGQFNDQSIRVVARYYNSGVATGLNINGTPLMNFKLGRLTFPQPAPNNTLAWYKSKVDEAVANNTWLIWMLHCGQPDFNATQQQILNDLILYIKSISVDVVTIQEGLDRVGNVLSVNNNELYIGADGKNNIANHIYAGNNPITGNETVTFDTAPSELEAGKTYISSISKVDSISKSPSGVRGVLTVYRTITPFHSYRTYVDANKNFFVSYSNASGDGWYEWSEAIKTSGQQEYTLASATIKSNSYFKFNMNPAPRLYNNFQYAIAHPIDPLPVGLIYSAHHNGSGGAVEVRLFNATTSDITLTDFRWKFIIMDAR